MMETRLDLVALFTLGEIGLILLYAIPLPISALQGLATLRPGFALFMGACITAAVPLFESSKLLIEYRPRAGETVAYESDPRWLASIITLYRSVFVVGLLLVFFMVQRLAVQLGETGQALEKMKLNRLATQKQAEAASKQSLAMLDEIESIKGGSKIKELEARNEELKMELRKIKDQLKVSQTDMETLKTQAKANEDECKRLIDRVHELESHGNESSAEPKKDR